jgi:hypothetical protein
MYGEIEWRGCWDCKRSNETLFVDVGNVITWLVGEPAIQEACNGWRIIIGLINAAAEEISAIVVVIHGICQRAVKAGNLFFFVGEAESRLQGLGDGSQCECAFFINGPSKEAQAAADDGVGVVGVERCRGLLGDGDYV